MVKCLGVAIGLVGLGLLVLTGCMTSADENDTTIDPIPDSWARTYMPIEFLGDYQFRHVDYTERGQAMVFEAGYRLRITDLGGYTGWRFNDDSVGLLLRRVSEGPVDQQGIHIVGTWTGRTRSPLSADSVMVDSLRPDSSVLWLPDAVSPSREPWVVYGRTLSVLSSDTVLHLPASYSSRGLPQDPVTGRIRVNARVICEVVGETTTYYALAAGIGLLAYERETGGRLVSTGVLLAAFSLKYPQRLWP